MGTTNGPRIQPPSPTAPRLSYVLVADANLQRAAVFIDVIKLFGLKSRVARNAHEALEMLRLSGAPALLVVDLSLPLSDGFGVIDALRRVDEGRSAIIAFAAAPEQREFAAQRFAGQNVRVLSGSVAPEILRGAVARALQRTADTGEARIAPEEQDPDAIHEAMRTLADEARKLSRTSGVAIYWKAPGETRFRAVVSWTSDTPTPHSADRLPRVFSWILETGETLVLPDVIADVPAAPAQDTVRGLVAVPILDCDRQIIGTICVFDLQPLTVTDEVVERLKALGRDAFCRSLDSTQGRPIDSAQGRLGEAGPSPVVTIRAASASAVMAPAQSPVTPDPFAAPLDRRDAALIIGREIARLRREERRLSVVAFAVNAIAAADVGATEMPMVELVGETLVRGVRAVDVAVRWSTEELVLMLPGLGAAEARPVAERVRAALQAATARKVAVAAGVAEVRTDESFESAVGRATEQLQVARARGHNRVA